MTTKDKRQMPSSTNEMTTTPDQNSFIVFMVPPYEVQGH
jgi:hypothetical protein